MVAIRRPEEFSISIQDILSVRNSKIELWISLRTENSVWRRLRRARLPLLLNEMSSHFLIRLNKISTTYLGRAKSYLAP